MSERKNIELYRLEGKSDGEIHEILEQMNYPKEKISFLIASTPKQENLEQNKFSIYLQFFLLCGIGVLHIIYGINNLYQGSLVGIIFLIKTVIISYVLFLFFQDKYNFLLYSFIISLISIQQGINNYYDLILPILILGLTLLNYQKLFPNLTYFGKVKNSV